VLQVIEPSGAEKVHDQVGPGEPNAIALDEEVFPIFVRHVRSYTMIFLLGGA
jgi:hypothetical protein